MPHVAKPPLQVMAETTDTDYWNDSCSIEELSYAIPKGAVGATTNPSIVYNVLEKEFSLWRDRILEIVSDNPGFDEDQVAWKLIQEMAIKGAELLKPVFDRELGMKGWLSIQTNAKFYRNAEAMTEQAIEFSKLAPNIQVKIPATSAGIKAIEEATFQGVNVNATVCFSVPQAIAVGEAVDRGLARREAEGLDVESMTPVCAIMVGRVDDWLKAVADNRNILVNPAYMDLAGVAVVKHAIKIYDKRGYKARLLVAAYRNWNHITELIGSHLIHTIPYKWQIRYNGSEMPVVSTASRDLDSEIIETLKRSFVDFVKAYEPDGMSIDEFESFGATRRTLRQFIAGYDSVIGVVRDLMIPNPDIE